MAAISSTRRFHRDMPIDLMKELTINESLSYLESPYMTCIENPRPFGRIVAEKLIETGVLKSGTKVMEAGGGYGSFMESFMTHSGHLVDIAVMTDLSRQLLKKQRARLCRHADKSLFFNADIHDILPAVSGIDLLIMNEVIGDLDTLTDIDPENLDAESRLLIHKYGLEIPSSGGFCLNTGAIRVVEAVCIRGMMAFFSEHSCDPILPDDMPWLGRGLDADGWPREITLFEHSEYTIRFSHLIKTAEKLGRKTLTGSYIDLVGLKRKPSYKFIFETGACSTPEQEIVLEFLDHIREYRWLIIM